jgi:NAD(P)H-flavin reductase
VLLMPEADKALIMVATGTGIAPFRAFWRRCFYENVPNYKFTGLFWLFMGVANSDSKLYDDELQAIKVSQPGAGAVYDAGQGWRALPMSSIGSLQTVMPRWDSLSHTQSGPLIKL